jgi:hypothetical protein
MKKRLLHTNGRRFEPCRAHTSPPVIAPSQSLGQAVGSIPAAARCTPSVVGTGPGARSAPGGCLLVCAAPRLGLCLHDRLLHDRLLRCRFLAGCCGGRFVVAVLGGSMAAAGSVRVWKSGVRRSWPIRGSRRSPRAGARLVPRPSTMWNVARPLSVGRRPAEPERSQPGRGRRWGVGGRPRRPA